MGTALREKCTEILGMFPGNVSYGFAYGSGVFIQKGHKSTKDNMIDLMLVVEDSISWHEKNLERFPMHYSFLRYLGSPVITKIQRSNFGAKVYFNTLVTINGSTIKYGVISKPDLIEDLTTWSKLYLAGRLHKPVLSLVTPDSELSGVIKHNLQNALRSALLLLPEKFTDRELYMTIANLSYEGDFRMVVGEDKRKVNNIVEPNMTHFHELYRPFYNDEYITYEKGRFKQDLSIDTTIKHLSRLPGSIQRSIPELDPSVRNESSLRQLASNKSKLAYALAAALSSIVFRTSVSQSLKGILTAGLVKSFVYSGKKVGKMFKGLLR